MQAISAHPIKTNISIPTLNGLIWWSLVIHIIVLLVIWNQAPTKPLLISEPLSIALVSQTRSTLKVPNTIETDKVLPASKPVLQGKAGIRRTHEKHITKKETPLEKLVDKNKTSTSKKQLIKKLLPTSINKLGETTYLHNKTKDRLQTSLGKQLRKYFYYPGLARKKGWQGKVKLELRVEGSGQLSHIRLMKSSGYASLDNAALKSLRKISLLPEARDWLQGMHYDIVVPVEYRLVDS